VAARTFLTIPKLWSSDNLPTDGPLDTRHKVLAVTIGVVFGFILGLTSVGSGVFFGLTLVTLFPLAARRVVGTDLFHAMLVTVAAGLATLVWGAPNFSVVGSILIGSIPGILIGSHFTARVNDRLLRGIIALVLAASGLKTLNSPSVAYVIGAVIIVSVAGFYALRAARVNSVRAARVNSELNPEPQA
jgi:uncharacterized membrane protein YfcA